MTVLPIIVLKCTWRMDLNMYLCPKNGLLFLSVKNCVAIVITVEDEIYKYTVREYSSAKKARVLQNIIGRHSSKDLFAKVCRKESAK